MSLSEKDRSRFDAAALAYRDALVTFAEFTATDEGHDEALDALNEAYGEMVSIIQAAREEASQGAGEPVDLEALLKDPNAVHLNMLRGGIAKLTPAQIGHLYRGEEAEEVIREVRRQNPETQGAGEPVAWRVKDFADGWFFYGKERGAEAMRAQVDGFLVQPLFTSPPTDPRTKALEEALETARDALQAAYQRTGHADDLAAAHIADAALLRTLETSNV